MTIGPMTATRPLPGDTSKRSVALVAAFSLLFMALLAPFAHFGVLQNLVVPADAAATTANIIGSTGLYRAAIAAFLIVVILDVVVAWALYVLLRPGNESLALLVAWLRVVYAAVFAFALVNLFDVAQLLSGATVTAGQSELLQAQVASSVASFANGWASALAIFGLHLVGLGALAFRSAAFPRLLGALVILAGTGYLADSFGKILLPGYSLTVSTFTFVGEALLIVWLFWIAIKAPRRSESSRIAVPAPGRSSEAVAS